MFKSKSYDLKHKNELKKRDNLCFNKKYQWSYFIAISVLKGFPILLLLANINLTSTTYAYVVNTTTTIMTEVITLQTEMMSTSRDYDDYNKVEESAQQNIAGNEHETIEIMGRASLKCQADENNPCKISCSGGVNSVKTALEAQQKKCTGVSLEVIFQNCQFPGGAMKTDFLKGNFYLHSLTISNCDLSFIWEQAFNQYSLSNTLKTLVIEKSQFNSLDNRRFAGLQVINYFRLENKEPDMFDFIGASFLQPIAATLNETKLLQYTTKGTKYNPLSWFTGANFVELLRVNLSNNYFPDTLGNKTFLTLTKVQQLILANCQIYTMQSGTFDTITKTLQYLDLSNNQLKTLSADFLSNLGNNLRLELSANSWNCTCENNDLIEIIQNSKIDLGEEAICTTPEDLEGINLKYVPLQCGDIISTIITTTTTTTAATPQTNPVDIVCKDYTKKTDFSKTIRNYDALFGVYSESSTSVLLLILNDMAKMRLIYFIPKLYFNSEYSETGKTPSTKVTSSRCERIVTSTIIHIGGLVPNQTYVFCLVPHDEVRISPFNCRSHQLMDSIDPREPWLHINDIAWLVPIVGICIIVCVILGSCVVYWLLRWHPTWLYGSKRLIKLDYKPHEMLLIPKEERFSEENQYLSGLAKMQSLTGDILEPEHLTANTYEYNFKRNFETSKLNKMEFLPENLPPSVPAPAIPSSSCSRRPALIQHSEHSEGFDNVYQSLDHYEFVGEF